MPEILKDPTNQFFFSVLLIVFLFALYFYIKGKKEKFVSVSPTLLTTIGILGTFVGIFIALLNFNPDPLELQYNISDFLGGVQTAFATSILGMGFGVVMRLLLAFKTSKKLDESSKTEEGFLSIFEEIRDSIKETNNQITLSRSEAKDSSNEIKKEFSKFAKTLAENNSKSLIEALEEVMRDFNTKINEQFGDNFKQLNEAVTALLQWQENYKAQIVTMETQFKRCAESIKETENSMLSIQESAYAIPIAMAKLPEITKNANETLQSFADLKEKAESAFPAIDEKLQALTASLQGQTEAFDNVFTAQKDLNDQARQQMKDAIEEMGGYIAGLLQNFQNRLTNVEV